jgi:hypothetical protein
MSRPGHIFARTSIGSGALILALIAAGCATQRGPDIRVNSAPDAKFSSYSTFGFPEQAGTDRAGYSTMVTDYFKIAVRTEMERRGYRYVEENPELLVNFFANARERTEVRSTPQMSTGYYNYRYGLYSTWPLYSSDVDTVTYKVGTANVDIVDARKKELIWEGIAEGRISESDMENPKEAIASVVTQLFTRFPGQAGVADRAGT